MFRYIIHKSSKLLAKKGEAFPSVIIIGAQKAATSTLFHLLSQHPNYVGSFVKEVHFFDDDINFDKGVDWYYRQFPVTRPGQILLEASPSYLYYQKAGQRIAALDFPVKFVVSLRNPIHRAYSAWNMYRHFSQASLLFKRMMKRRYHFSDSFYNLLKSGRFPSFNEMIGHELNLIYTGQNYDEPSLVGRGLYLEQIRNWLKYFPLERFHFLQMEGLNSTQGLQTSLNDISHFCGFPLSNAYFKDINLMFQNKRDYASNIHEDLSKENYDKLKRLYHSRNRGLNKITKLDLDW